jgi:acetyl esterase/lipase
MKRALLPLLSLTAVAGYAQLSQSATWATTAANNYRTVPNVTYLTAGGTDLKLDVYQKRNVQGPQPTLIYMHGGFWVAGNKEGAVAMLLPWMEMGWNVVNVEYRLGPVALAPAALEDCLCALRFLTTQANATAYNIDVNRIVVMGESAGGHLALSLGMVPDSANLDLECAAATPLPKVAAVLNWFGITDVGDVIDGPNRRPAATRWFGSMPNRMEIAKRVSPMTYVRNGLPPIMTIHGDADPVVPYPQAVRLHEALAKTNTPNQLITIPGGGHGGFTDAQRTMIYTTIREFLGKHGLGAR